MIFAFLLTVFIGLCAVALIGLEDSHHRVSRLLAELDEQAAQSHRKLRASPVTPTPADEATDVSFTRSLLALGKVESLVPGDSPVPARAESSSLVSVPRDQSKSHVQVL